MKKINSASEALEVFNAKFAGLIGEVKGEFKKRFIQTPGREYLAYVLPDDKRETMYIVPFHTEEKPCIEKYDPDCSRIYPQSHLYKPPYPPPLHSDYYINSIIHYIIA